jgi:hypothetical protein
VAVHACGSPARRRRNADHGRRSLRYVSPVFTAAITNAYVSIAARTPLEVMDLILAITNVARRALLSGEASKS